MQNITTGLFILTAAIVTKYYRKNAQNSIETKDTIESFSISGEYKRFLEIGPIHQ